MRVTTEMFHEAHRPPAHINTVHDAGCLWVDLDGDQPPYCGLMLALSHPDLPDREFVQMYRLTNEMVTSLIHELMPYMRVPSVD